MSDRIVESLNEMKQIYLESVSGQVVSERDEYLQYIEEKMKKMKKKDEEEEEDDADQDYDEDGEIESGEEEHAGSVHNAIQRKMGGIPDGNPPKRRKKLMKESLSNWRNELYEKVGDVEADIESSKQRKIEERSNINNKIEINPNVNIGEQVELSEEYIEEVVDIASQYFYEQGLNEEGLEMVIEELGYDKFIEYVFYISEDFILTEARTLLGKKKTPAKGKERGISLKAAPGKTTKAAVKKYGTTRKFSSFSPTGTVRKKVVTSQGGDAVEKAVETQKPVERRHRRHGKVVPGPRPTSKPTNTKPQTQPQTQTPKGFERAAGQVRDFVTSQDTKDKLRNMVDAAVSKAKSDIGRTGMAAIHATGAAKKARQRGASGAGAAGAAVGTFIRGLMRGSTATGVKEEIEAFLLEKSESQQQQKLFGLALSVVKGETPRSEVSKEVLDIVDGMPEKEIRKFAKTPHKGLPKKVEN